jgi:hypothetical protein
MIQMDLQHEIFNASEDGKIYVFTECSFSVGHKWVLRVAGVFSDLMGSLCLPQSVKLFS